MARIAALLLVAACLAPVAFAIPPLWVQKHAKTCSENLPLGGHFPSTTVGHGAAGPVALDPSLSFIIVNANGSVISGPVCQGQEVGVAVLFQEPRAFLLTASDDNVKFASSPEAPGSVGPNPEDPLNCTNRVYTAPAGQIAPVPPLALNNATTVMTIPCGAGNINLTITTAKGRGQQHLQATTLVRSIPCGCSAAAPGVAPVAPANLETSGAGAGAVVESSTAGGAAIETSAGGAGGVAGLETSGAGPESPSLGGAGPESPSLGGFAPVPRGSTPSPSAPAPGTASASSLQASMLLGAIMTVLAMAAF